MLPAGHQKHFEEEKKRAILQMNELKEIKKKSGVNIPLLEEAIGYLEKYIAALDKLLK